MQFDHSSQHKYNQYRYDLSVVVVPPAVPTTPCEPTPNNVISLRIAVEPKIPRSLPTLTEPHDLSPNVKNA